MKQERGPELNAGRARVLARRGPGLYRRPSPARDRVYPGLREQRDREDAIPPCLGSYGCGANRQPKT